MAYRQNLVCLRQLTLTAAAVICLNSSMRCGRPCFWWCQKSALEPGTRNPSQPCCCTRQDVLMFVSTVAARVRKLHPDIVRSLRRSSVMPLCRLRVQGALVSRAIFASAAWWRC